GKHKFDVTKHVVWPGRLIDLEIADIHLVPIDRARIDITAEIFDAQLVTLEHRRVPSAPAEEPGSLLAKIRPDLLDLDRGRHVPERVEHDLLHLAGEDRRLLVRSTRVACTVLLSSTTRSMNSGC